MNKITYVTVLLLLVAQFSFSQEKIISKRIEIQNPSRSQLLQIKDVGFDLACDAIFKNNNLILEIGEQQLNELDSRNINYNILVEDLIQHYREKTERELPAAKAELEQLKAISYSQRSISTQTESIDNFIQYEGCSEVDWSVPQNFNLGSMAGCLTYSEMLAELDEMRALYPNLISVKTDASPTNQKTHGNSYTTGGYDSWAGQPIYYVRISDNPDTDETNEPESLYSGMTHSREVSSMMNLIYYMWYILENYEYDPGIKNLVDNHEMYFIPVANPDGLMWNEQYAPSGGGMQRKNLGPYNTGNNTVRGADLNRNYDYFWGPNAIYGGSSGSVTSDTYRGPNAFSEPETQIVRDFSATRQFKTAMNHHATSNLIPHAYNGYPAAPASGREAEYHKFCHDMTRFNRYIYGEAPDILTIANGDMSDWMLGGVADVNGSTGSGQGILALAPENGAWDGSEGGFWPNTSDIVTIAQRAMRMNFANVYHSAKFAQFHDLNTSDVTSTSGNFEFGIEYLGQTLGDITLNVTPVSSNIISITPPGTQTGWSKLEQRTLTAAYTLNGGIQPNDIIEFQVTLSNDDGYVMYQANIIKYYNPTVLSVDDPDTTGMANWTTSGGSWSTTSDAYSGSSAITDSPSGSYGNNVSKTITYNSTIDLSTTAGAVVQFYAKWDLERNFDYVQIQGSTNGTTWIPLCGKYTKPGSDYLTNRYSSGNSSNTTDPNRSSTTNQPSGEMLYDSDTMDKWVMEEIFIDASNNSSLLGASNVQFRFLLDSDNTNRADGYPTTFDGFSFDDFKVISLSKLAQTISFDPVLDKVTVSPDFDVTATASSGLPITYSIVSGPATISGNTITLTGGLGTVVVEAAQSGNGNYNTATSVTRSFNVAEVVCLGDQVTTYPYTESFESGLGFWSQGSGDDMNWTENSGGTVSSGTGPSGASDGSQYLYTEASSPNNPSKSAYLISPCFDLTGLENSQLEFDYHMFGTSLGTLNVEVSLDNGANYTSVSTLNTASQDLWKTETINLSAYDGEIIKIRFNAVTGTSWSSDIAIDKINFTATPAAASAPPTALCQNITIALDATGNASITPNQIDNGSSDDVGIEIYSLDIDTFNCTNIGDNTVILTVEDADGQTDTCSATVTVTNNPVPTVTDLPDLTDECSVTPTAPTATDCIGTITGITSTPFPITETTTITWTYTRLSPFAFTTQEQEVIITDSENPTITCPADVSVNTDPGTCTYDSTQLTLPTVSDNCNIGSTVASPATLVLGSNTVTWTVTDGSGLTATCEQTVTVVDNIVPTITCPADVSVNVDAGLCTASSVDLGTAPTGADNCSVASVTNDAPATYPLGDTTVTWTVTDGSGLTATCEQTVTVVDNIVPTITCPADVSVNVDAGLCTASSVDLGTAPTGADNCSVASVTNDAPATYPLGDTTVTWTVTDGSGLTATCEQTVTVVDNIVPTITCPADVSVNVDAGLCTASSVDLGTAPTGADNCSVASVTNDAPATYPLGDTTVTWTVTDGSGLTATCEQTVTVVDNIVPTITCPADVSVNVDAGLCTASSVDLGTAPTGADNCSVASVTNDAPATYPLGDTTVTWTVTDGSGLTATCEQTVTVVDNIVPTITCPADVSVNVDAGLCTASSVDLGTAPTGADNCSVASVTNDAPATYPLGDTTVTWTVTDGSGLTATCEQTVTVVDNIVPTITCPADVSVNVDAGLCTASSVDLGTAPTGADNCSVASVTNDAPATYPLGDTTVTWTVTDGSGLTATCEQTVTVVDNIVPTITCPADVSVNVDAGLCTASSVDLGTAPTGADNCSVASVTNDAPATYPLGDTTVTWTVTDGSGLTATCEQTVTVVDNIVPTITCPADVSVNVDAGLCTASSVDLGTAPTGADNCSVASVTNDAPATYPLGDTTVTWTVTDGSGLTATCEQTVTVVDNIVPTITCPADVSVNVDAGLCTASSVDLGTAPTGADNCSVASVTNDAPATYPLGDTTVTWTVTDGSGLTATCEQTVTVVDNIVPTITCPADVSVNVDAGLCTASSVDLGTAPTGADNCSVASVTNDAPATYPLGDTTVTWTVTDGSGLTATCEQTVTVVDNIVPTITCPADVSVNVDAGLCTASSVDLGTAPTGADNCSVASVTNDAPATYPLGDTTVTWTVTDGSGLTATCEQTVTVVDNIVPTITCPADVSVNVDAGLCTASSVDLGTAPTGADNCSVASVTNDAPATYPLGDTTVTWTVTDGSGLTATCEQTVTVVDNIVPTITCPADVSVNVDAGLCTASSVDLGTAPTGADNCSVASVTNDAPATYPLGDTTVTWTVTDGSGLTATCEQTVTVVDNIVPTITCPADVSVNVDAGLCTASSVDLGTAPTGADNCSVASVTNDAPATYPLGDTTVTWTVTDGSGLTATCEQTVTVVDNIVPTITCPADVSVNVDAGLCTASSVDLVTAPTGADNCSVASVTNDAPATYPLGDTTVTWTVTDGSGLTATCEQTVTVVDNIVPTITCPADVSVNVDAGLCTASSVDLGTAPTGADNCSVASVTNDAPATYPLGDTTVTWTVTDGSGLTATCEQTVTVVDNIVPTITCPADFSVNVDAGLCTASSVDLGTAPTGADNCSVASVTNDAPATYPLGDTTVTWTVTDGSGLTATCEQTVTVVDNIVPVCLATDITVDLAGGTKTITGADIDNGSTDNCGISTLVASPNFFDGTNMGDNTVTLTVTDLNGNSSNCVITVTVEDSTLGNQEFEVIEGVNVYPNPFNEKLNIKLPPSFYGRTININILDIRGRLIKSLKKEYLNSVLIIEEFDDFEEGSYFIKITSNLEKILFKQLIKK